MVGWARGGSFGGDGRREGWAIELLLVDKGGLLKP